MRRGRDCRDAGRCRDDDLHHPHFSRGQRTISRRVMEATPTPQIWFPGWSSGWVLVHWFAVLLAISLIVWLFRWERRLVPPRVGTVLLGLRLTSLAVVLLTLLQPTWAWVLKQDRTGQVIVALDVSESMLTTDLHATVPERLRWAAAVGWLQPHPQRLAATFDADSGGAMPLAIPDGLDAETWETLNTQLADLTRLELARRTMFDGEPSVWQRLEPVGRRSLRLFGGAVTSADPANLTETLSQPITAAQQEATRVAALLSAIDPADSESPVLGVVILTDGRDADAVRALSLATSFGQNQVPLYPVLVASTQRPKDLSIVAVDVPPAVYRGDSPQVKVLLSTAGFTGDPLEVRLEPLEPDDRFPPQTRTITTADGPQQVEFALPAEELGDFPFRVVLPEWDSETRYDNNQREFLLQVVDDRTRALLVDSEPRWEFRYLEIALDRDERVDLEVVLFRQPYLGMLREPYFSRTWPTPAADGTTPGVTDRDLIIVGDVSAQELNDARWQELERFVSDQGGLLVLIAGRSEMPLGQTSPAFRTLLPITAPQQVLAAGRAAVSPTNRGWTWTLTPEGRQQSLLQMDADAVVSQEIWNLLPGASWAVSGTPKPGATVWAEGRDETTQAAIPLIVQQYVGLGQVIWLATDSTWRWRFRSADQYHHRFWGQLARYAAEAKLSSGNEFVQFGPIQPHVAAGKPVEFQARWSAKFLEQTPRQRPVHVEIYRGDEMLLQVPLETDPRRPLISNGQASSLAAGEYRARLVAPQRDLGPHPIEANFTVAPPTTAELAELSANVAFLQELAAASGGRLLHLDEAAELPDLLQPWLSQITLPQEQSLWDRWPTYLLLAMLLTTEWLLRRRHGLP